MFNSSVLQSVFTSDNNGGVDVYKFKYKETKYQIEAKKIIGGSLFEKYNTPRGGKKQSTVKFK
jgi:hypothetical protein